LACTLHGPTCEGPVLAVPSSSKTLAYYLVVLEVARRELSREVVCVGGGAMMGL